MILIALLTWILAFSPTLPSASANPLQKAIDLPWKKASRLMSSPQSCGPTEVGAPVDCEKFDGKLPGFDSEHPPFRRLGAHKKPWEILDSRGNPGSPAAFLTPMSRVILLESPESGKTNLHVAFTVGKQIRSGYLPASALTARNPQNVSTEDEMQSYLQDARLQLELARELSKHRSALAPEFQSLIQRLHTQLSCVENTKKKISDAKWRRFKTKTEAKFKNTSGNKVETLESFQRNIWATHDPTGPNGKLSDRTLVVPLSMDWFNSNTELKSYFSQVWNPQKNDVKMASGSSGEGITRAADSPGNMQYRDMFQRFVELKKYLDEKKDPNLLRSPEYLWLKKTVAQDPKNFDRMIFIHPETWKSSPQTASWQDYIPVDQSLGPIVSDPVLSTLVHEINVNSPHFLPDDTHGPYDESARLWNCAASQGHASFANSAPEEKAKFLGIQPYLGTVTLGMSLPELARNLGCQ